MSVGRIRAREPRDDAAWPGLGPFTDPINLNYLDLPTKSGVKGDLRSGGRFVREVAKTCRNVK